ncbi:hypothetical protein [Ancylobacter defluvii]|uniref:Uncharacterized protein n=1 Tax=Ancylobacter defluvii TaxID=1282440 RepID=A0A9W6JXP7_9HYPH|nr:hypothetical protein [Ancylobacter defluvii]MBS7587037.1 hypothetical protein [Ancylobacter defluvii]GLK84486.1 hypothetical protein GCM10017653_25560 [Ancylobacter defluvii]
MQSKWQALACCVGVAALCVLYVLVVPGVRFLDMCAGAGLGAALMWALNEWESGKWGKWERPSRESTKLAAPKRKVAAPRPAAPLRAVVLVRPRPASAALAAPAPVAAPLRSPPPAPAALEADHFWEFDDAARDAPDWDASILAETWAKLRNELAIACDDPPPRETVAVDLPPAAAFGRQSRPMDDSPAYREPQPTPARPPVSRLPMRQPVDSGEKPSPRLARAVPPAFLRPSARRPR